jgi:hypothetical protein
MSVMRVMRAAIRSAVRDLLWRVAFWVLFRMGAFMLYFVERGPEIARFF